MLKVKVCGMTDLLNISEIKECSPDYLGFIFYPASKRFVGTDPDNILFSSIPDGIRKTGVFVNEDEEVIVDKAKRYGIDMVQLHGDESPGFCNFLQKAGLTVIKAFNIDDSFKFTSIIKYVDSCSWFLFDTKSADRGGNGLKFNWNRILEYDIKKPFFLSGGIGPDDVQEIRQIKNTNLFAIDINSRFESKYGIKDINKVGKFIKEIRQ